MRHLRTCLVLLPFATTACSAQPSPTNELVTSIPPPSATVIDEPSWPDAVGALPEQAIVLIRLEMTGDARIDPAIVVDAFMPSGEVVATALIPQVGQIPAGHVLVDASRLLGGRHLLLRYSAEVEPTPEEDRPLVEIWQLVDLAQPQLDERQLVEEPYALLAGPDGLAMFIDQRPEGQRATVLNLQTAERNVFWLQPSKLPIAWLADGSGLLASNLTAVISPVDGSQEHVEDLPALHLPFVAGHYLSQQLEGIRQLGVDAPGDIVSTPHGQDAVGTVWMGDMSDHALYVGWDPDGVGIVVVDRALTVTHCRAPLTCDQLGRIPLELGQQEFASIAGVQWSGLGDGLDLVIHVETWGPQSTGRPQWASYYAFSTATGDLVPLIAEGPDASAFVGFGGD